jgi:hypothetical protein
MPSTDWKPWCVGRNLINLPVGATVVDFKDDLEEISPGFRTKIDGNVFKRLAGVTAEQAEKLVRQRIEELKAMPHKTQGCWYIGHYALPGGGVVIRHWGGGEYAGLNTGECYLVAQSSKNLVCTYADDYVPEDHERAMRWYPQLAKALDALAPGEIPTVPGFCGDGFILKDTRSGREESAFLPVRLPGYPKGLVFNYAAATSTPSRKALANKPDAVEERCFQIGDRDELIKCETLRNGKHKVGPINGYEVCVAGKANNARVRLYTFYWQTPGVPYAYGENIMNADLLYTVTSIQGAGLNPQTVPDVFFSDEEGLGLWDALIDSIRLRPGAVDPNNQKLVE